MASYVFSDIHGRAKALDRMLEKLNLSDDDNLFMLGDMADRGPNGIQVINIIRSLNNVHCIMGNHEEIFLDCIDHPEDDARWFMWAQNGSSNTIEGLKKMKKEKRDELFDWLRALPSYAYTHVGKRPFIFTHAGIVPPSTTSVEKLISVTGVWDKDAIESLMIRQNPTDLRWVREGFWDKPTNLLDSSGNGPIIIAGHTLTPYVEPLAYGMDTKAMDENGMCQILKCGMVKETNFIPDKIAIDCGCAAGYPIGRLACLRLDDMKVIYEDIREDE